MVYESHKAHKPLYVKLTCTAHVHTSMWHTLIWEVQAHGGKPIDPESCLVGALQVTEMKLSFFLYPE